jgi:hypothetical protein
MDEPTYLSSISVLHRCIVAIIESECKTAEHIRRHAGRILLNNARAYLYEQYFGKPPTQGAKEPRPLNMTPDEYDAPSYYEDPRYE